MKRIIIVRHAKSVPYGYDDDFHRDLTDRGIHDAEKISSKLADLNISPDLIIASPATRTMHTARVFSHKLNYDVSKIRTELAFYEGMTTQRFVDMVHEFSEEFETVMAVGHNPTVYYLVYNLVKYFNADMPTCSTVVIDFAVERWTDVAARLGQITFHFIPKSL